MDEEECWDPVEKTDEVSQSAPTQLKIALRILKIGQNHLLLEPSEIIFLMVLIQKIHSTKKVVNQSEQGMKIDLTEGIFFILSEINFPSLKYDLN
uniref:Uncharacterized protein n=1 Tax=Trichogramma kaykai TaxID=54128 RepID=A0ABD2XGW0_9HYME